MIINFNYEQNLNIQQNLKQLPTGEEITKEKNNYKKYWDSINKKEITKKFSDIYKPYIDEAVIIFKNLTAIDLQHEIVVNFIMTKTLKDQNNRVKGNALHLLCCFSKEVFKQAKVGDDYLKEIVIQISDYFTDRYFERSKSIPKNKDDRNEFSKYLTGCFFKNLLIKDLDVSDQSKLSEDLKTFVDKNYLKQNKEIKIVHIGEESRQYKQDMNAAHYKLIPDLFLIGKRKETYIFYAALLNRVLEVSTSLVESVNPLVYKKVYINYFIASALLIPRELDLFPSAIDPVIYKKAAGKLRFHMTDKCNLRCTYCYLSGGKGKTVISTDIAEQALKIFSDNSQGDFENIEFHGGGEPTLAFEQIKQIWEISHKYCQNLPRFTVQSNGLFSRKKADWFIEKNFIVSISIDGPRDIHTKQRPGSKTSYDRILKTIKYLRESGITIYAIATITEYSSLRLAEIYEYLKNLGFIRMIINPSVSLGRVDPNGEPWQRSVDLRKFSENFLPVKLQANKDNIILDNELLPSFYWGISNHKCGVCLPISNVHYNGDLVGCTRLYDIEKPETNPFVWGKIEDNKLKVDQAKVKRLQERTVNNIPECKDCFIKWVCAGDCPGVSYQKTGDFNNLDPERCDIFRWYAREYMLSFAN